MDTTFTHTGTTHTDASGLPLVVDRSPEWGSDRLDLDAYLARVGYRGPREASLAALRALHRAHRDSVCFENVDIALGRAVSLDLDAVQRKIVQAGRGGYCYETNLLFAAALDRFGFPVTRLLVRIREGSAKRRFRSHTALLVRADDMVWLADPGYGYAALIEPLALRAGAESTVDGWSWRLTTEDGHWLLQYRRPEGWFDIYAFRTEPQYAVDFEAAHYVSSTRPGSPFVGQLVVQRAGDEERYRLKNTEFMTEYRGGEQRLRVLRPHEAVDVVRGTFRLPLTAEEERLLHDFLAARR
ncbi:arylamine N-acetyltransferase [Streptomyces sp. 15-116A]|uniref:arylamine N-acetyltransferase family protein n=1 Tax=Streptomyces sp. 15-116A TaxID=2259035 RepID=UPI0021B1EDC5|nr:arylamine N-acetyltransferase [Streptomyces sp. 15-116A]MCT7356776.1 arylamine N-acetyltransferase [Streptomyces sp. 15-116A]